VEETIVSDLSLVLIIALLPLVAILLIVQVNPYHALVIRGVLGAVAALVDALLGAADVALTEALVGTMLATALYAVAVRSSLVFRLGILQEELRSSSLINELRTILGKRFVRLELVPYGDRKLLETAMLDREVHGTCMLAQAQERETLCYQTQTRIQRIYDILKSELASSEMILTYVNLAKPQEKH
jgi:putative multicomponent Na+:H+ antiporter subunit B